ncbi:hypothetical protein M5K25_026330 [Dendrobium thyrsiflorum]|uniref:Uncharacterized protein n=1 Tax=Dendrobium thyrsiflorum TaxID=117978 RepID=A0ABD0TXA9_DENTH
MNLRLHLLLKEKKRRLMRVRRMKLLVKYQQYFIAIWQFDLFELTTWNYLMQREIDFDDDFMVRVPEGGEFLKSLKDDELLFYHDQSHLGLRLCFLPKVEFFTKFHGKESHNVKYTLKSSVKAAVCLGEPSSSKLPKKQDLLFVRAKLA